jgi:hypothetical protein
VSAQVILARESLSTSRSRAYEYVSCSVARVSLSMAFKIGFQPEDLGATSNGTPEPTVVLAVNMGAVDVSLHMVL